MNIPAVLEPSSHYMDCLHDLRGAGYTPSHPTYRHFAELKRLAVEKEVFIRRQLDFINIQQMEKN